MGGFLLWILVNYKCVLFKVLTLASFPVLKATIIKRKAQEGGGQKRGRAGCVSVIGDA